MQQRRELPQPQVRARVRPLALQRPWWRRSEGSQVSTHTACSEEEALSFCKINTPVNLFERNKQSKLASLPTDGRIISGSKRLRSHNAGITQSALPAALFAFMVKGHRGGADRKGAGCKPGQQTQAALLTSLIVRVRVILAVLVLVLLLHRGFCLRKRIFRSEVTLPSVLDQNRPVKRL